MLSIPGYILGHERVRCANCNQNLMRTTVFEERAVDRTHGFS